MATQEEAIVLFTRRIKPKIMREMTFQQIAQAVGASSPAEKAELVAAVRRNAKPAVGEIILLAVNRKADALAQAEATAIVQDGVVDLEELDRIL